MAGESLIKYLPPDAVIPREELAKRHTRIRSLMGERNLDLLFIAADMNIHKRGHVRYVSGYCTKDYYAYVLFPLEGELTFFGHYRAFTRWAEALSGITKLGFTPFGEEEAVGASHIVELVKAYKPRRLGMVGGYTMTANLYQTLVSNLPGVHLEEATDLLTACRLAKDPYEIGMVEKAARVADAAYQTYLDSVRPDKKEIDVIMEVKRKVFDQGGEDGIYLFTGGGVPHVRFENMAYRTLEERDTLYFTSEICGPGGYWTQIGRMVSLGKRVPEVERAVKDFLKAREVALPELAPGSTIGRFITKFVETAQRMGYKLRDDQFGHGMGLDITEPPFLTLDDPTPVEAGMVLAVHPMFDLGQYNARVCDTFLVTESGPRNLYATPTDYCVF
jgi:Xaa-Pro aminopeptidase